MRKRLLIDADILAYTTAAVNEHTIDWGEGETTHHTTPDCANDQIVDELNALRSLFPGHKLYACFTGSKNWRKDIYPEYKANRKDRVKPELLEHCKLHISDNCDRTLLISPLEADDVMGLAATLSVGWESIIVSSDKDMKTIADCSIYNPRKPDLGVVKTTKESALFNQMFQALTGDTSDGYPGLPGVGEVRAKKILDGSENLWASVVMAYQDKGLTEADALVQARLSKILDYTVWTAWVGLAEQYSWPHIEPFWED